MLQEVVVSVTAHLALLVLQLQLQHTRKQLLDVGVDVVCISMESRR